MLTRRDCQSMPSPGPRSLTTAPLTAAILVDSIAYGISAPRDDMPVTQRMTGFRISLGQVTPSPTLPKSL